MVAAVAVTAVMAAAAADALRGGTRDAVLRDVARLRARMRAARGDNAQRATPLF
jgi:hypothetical protein